MAFLFFPPGGPPFSKSGYDLTPLTPEEVDSMVDKLTELQKVVLTQASKEPNTRHTRTNRRTRSRAENGVYW